MGLIESKIDRDWSAVKTDRAQLASGISEGLLRP
jgi:hypothetical protein